MLSPQGHSFENLAKLNAGVILEPLVSPQPIAELDPFVARGLASLSGHAVKEVIASHTEPGSEFRTLLNRYKQIRCSVPPSALGEFGYPVAGEPDEPTREPRHRQRSAEEVFSEMIFGKGDDPDFDKIDVVVKRNPRDPSTLTFLEKLFAENGFDLDDPEIPKLRKSFAGATAQAIHHNIFVNPRGGVVPSNSELERLAVEWIQSLPESVSDVGRGLRIGMIKSVIESADPKSVDPNFAAHFLEKVLSAADKLVKNLTDTSDAADVISINIRRIRFAAINKLFSYGVQDCERIADALASVGHEIKVAPIVRDDGTRAVMVNYNNDDAQSEAA